MLRSALQWLGLASVVGLAGVGVGALALVKDRIEVTVQPADDGDRLDPLALVRDELRQIHVDLEAVVRGLEQSLGEVGKAIDAGEARDLELQRQVSALASASVSSGIEARLDSLRSDLANLGAGIAASMTDAAPTATGQPEVVEMPAVGEAEPVAEVASPPLSDVAAASTPAPVTPGPRRFLSFSLPSSGFEFDTPQHYRVIPSLSRVGFDAKSTLHDFTGVTSAVSGDVHANLADPSIAWRGSIRCDARTLRTGVDGRDEGLREHLLTADHAEIVFELTGFMPDLAAGGIDAPRQTASGKVQGRMTIRGKTREVEMPVSISVDASRRVVVSGEMSLRLPDYEVPVPSQLGLISMQEEVKVWIELRARSVGPAAEVSRGR